MLFMNSIFTFLGFIHCLEFGANTLRIKYFQNNSNGKSQAETPLNFLDLLANPRAGLVRSLTGCF